MAYTESVLGVRKGAKTMQVRQQATACSGQPCVRCLLNAR
jgi:hypothetical protein